MAKITGSEVSETPIQIITDRRVSTKKQHKAKRIIIKHSNGNTYRKSKIAVQHAYIPSLVDEQGG